ncbi:phage antirepressor [Streptococcus anginosus]|uniref:phage antirepressor n=1 Tax=Streptococcus anginosus TaxID=1328 RepID=UPI00200126AF|nr:phage antirepressor [Streptococcus anginosus]
MNEVFNFHGQEVRTVTIDNDPYFSNADVCKILEINNPSQALKRLKQDGVITNEVIDGLGRKQDMKFVSESNLYKLIFQSKKKEAEAFTDWVTSEVLPAIRKHGLYAIDDLLDNPDMAIAALQKLKEERQLRLQAQEEVAQKNQIIQELQPKATYYDLVLQNKTLVPISVIAKDYGMSATKLNKVLHELKVQYKQGNTWLLYQKYASKGYTQSKTHTIDADYSKMHTYWTQKGRLFIYDLLKNKKNILPLIEQEEVA